jgi:hypothetical protein
MVDEDASSHPLASLARGAMCVVAGVLAAMGLLFPLYPVTAVGWAVYLATLTGFVLSLGLAASALRELRAPKRRGLAWRCVGVIIAIAPTVVFFGFAERHADFMVANFHAPGNRP